MTEDQDDKRLSDFMNACFWRDARLAALCTALVIAAHFIAKYW